MENLDTCRNEDSPPLNLKQEAQPGIPVFTVHDQHFPLLDLFSCVPNMHKNVVCVCLDIIVNQPYVINDNNKLL